MRPVPSLRACLSAALLAGTLAARPAGECYRVETIAFPPDAAPEVGAVAFDARGTLYVALRRGDILTATATADPRAFDWRVFATGFDNALGLVVPQPGRVLVLHMPELTEAVDTDGDGIADRYRKIADGWGLSGNYHEVNTLAPDGRGGFYIGLGTASHRSPTFVHTRGEYSAIGRRGRNYSAVKYRGWTLHLRADGTLEPFASGFRVINGILVDDAGVVWGSDNQGDWKPTTPFYHLEPGKFYGHVSSRVWEPQWPAGKDPLAFYRGDLDAYNADRAPAAVEIPHEMIHSGSEPIQIPRTGEFGGFGGQILLPDAAGSGIARLMLERVDGVYQGAATVFLAGQGLHVSNNRVCFSPDRRTLYVGQTARGWGMSRGGDTEGLQRIVWLGGTPFTVERMNLTAAGFRLTFTEPVNAAARLPASYEVQSMTYQPRWVYGGIAENKRDHAVTRVTPIDSRTVELGVAALAPGRVYRLRLAAGVQSGTGETVAHPEFFYTANRLPRPAADAP